MLGFVKEAFTMEREYRKLAGLACKVAIDGYTDFIFLNRDGGTFYAAMEAHHDINIPNCRTGWLGIFLSNPDVTSV